MNHIRALISAGCASLRRARPTNATEGGQFAVARWLMDGKLSVRYGADVPYPKLRLTPTTVEDGWGVAEVEIRHPDGKFVTAKFHVEILTHRGDAPDDVIILSKEEIDEFATFHRKVLELQNICTELELIQKELGSQLAADMETTDSTQLAEKKSEASP